MSNQQKQQVWETIRARLAAAEELEQHIIDTYQTPEGRLTTKQAAVLDYRCKTRGCRLLHAWRTPAVQDVQGVSAQAVELPHHDGVAIAHVIEEGSQTWTVIPSARHGVGEGFRHASGGQSGVLLPQGLGNGADPRITYTRTSARRHGCMRISMSHNALNNPCETFIPEIDF